LKTRYINSLFDFLILILQLKKLYRHYSTTVLVVGVRMSVSGSKDPLIVAICP